MTTRTYSKNEEKSKSTNDAPLLQRVRTLHPRDTLPHVERDGTAHSRRVPPAGVARAVVRPCLPELSGKIKKVRKKLRILKTFFNFVSLNYHNNEYK